MPVQSIADLNRLADRLSRREVSEDDALADIGVTQARVRLTFERSFPAVLNSGAWDSVMQQFNYLNRTRPVLAEHVREYSRRLQAAFTMNRKALVAVLPIKAPADGIPVGFFDTPVPFQTRQAADYR